MEIKPVDLANPAHCAALTSLLNEYASNPSGGDQPIDSAVLQALPGILSQCPTYTGLLAWEDAQQRTAIGLVNAFWSVSTFKAKRLLNIHDIAVSPAWHRQGIGRHLLREIETLALELGCAKITLEVLEGNAPAIALYKLLGFENYQLDPTMGDAKFMQKWLADQ